MDNFKIYSVTDEYIDYLRIIEPNVYSNKVENRIIRMIEKNNGVRELKGTLRISHMIPVPESELILYDLENEEVGYVKTALDFKKLDL